MAELSLIIMAILVMIGVPIAFSLMASTILFFVFNDLSLMGFAHRTVIGSENFLLTAVPFFVLAAVIMNTGGLTRRVISFADSIIGHLPGSLAQVNIVASMVNSGITGSSLADAAGVGGIIIPEMIKKGYSRAFSAVVTAASATIGPLVPPSIAFVIYGSIAGVSIGSLFLAGAIPGILVGISLIIATRYISVKRNYERGPKPTFNGILNGFKNGFFAIGMPLMILGGIGFGVFTPTEAAAVACFYAFLVSTVIYRELKFKHIKKICNDTILFSAPPLLVIVAMSAFSVMLTWQQIPQKITEKVLLLSTDPVTILFFLLLTFLVLGFITDGFPIFFLVTPMLIPVANLVGIDLVHLGVLIVITVLLGNLTPPFGLLMFLSCNIAECSMVDFAKEVWPYILSMAIVIIVLSIFPQIVLWLPNIIMNYPM